MQADKPTVVIVGAGGRLGARLAQAYRAEMNVIAFNHAQLDLGRPDTLRATLAPLKVDCLVNAAALTNVDYCENNRAEAMQLNAEGPRLLAEICGEKHARFVHVSTDYVFDGEKPAPYTEKDPPNPISVYGESKREGELRVLAVNPRALVLRVSWVFGPDRPSFVDAILQKARAEEKVAAVADKFSTPTYTPDIAEMLRPVVAGRVEASPTGNLAGYSGILHFANSGQCSWQEYAQWALDCCHDLGMPMKARTVGALSLGQMKNFVARRPRNTVLATEKYERLSGRRPRPWREAVREYVQAHYTRSGVHET